MQNKSHLPKKDETDGAGEIDGAEMGIQEDEGFIDEDGADEGKPKHLANNISHWNLNIVFYLTKFTIMLVKSNRFS